MKALKRTLGILLSMLILISAFSGISLPQCQVMN